MMRAGAVCDEVIDAQVVQDFLYPFASCISRSTALVDAASVNNSLWVGGPQGTPHAPARGCWDAGQHTRGVSGTLHKATPGLHRRRRMIVRALLRVGAPKHKKLDSFSPDVESASHVD